MLARLPAGAFAVDVARGGIVVESALLAALQAGHLAGAALDVFATEPLPPEHPLWTAPGVIVTPHIAGRGERYLERCVEVLAANAARLAAGQPRLHLVDRAGGY
jgi:phosphoglycerate dehydrogenase-like enzyme